MQISFEVQIPVNGTAPVQAPVCLRGRGEDIYRIRDLVHMGPTKTFVRREPGEVLERSEPLLILQGHGVTLLSSDVRVRIVSVEREPHRAFFTVSLEVASSVDIQVVSAQFNASEGAIELMTT